MLKVDEMYWRGRPMRDLSHAELLDIIAWYANELAQYRTPEAMRAAALSRVEMAKRYGTLR